MKDIISSFTVFYKKNTNRVRGIYRKKGIRPGTDWKIIVFTFIFFVLCAAVVNVFIYLGVKNNSWWPVPEVGASYQVKIDKRLLQTVLDRFNRQAEELRSLKEIPSVQADPSL